MISELDDVAWSRASNITVPGGNEGFDPSGCCCSIVINQCKDQMRLRATPSPYLRNGNSEICLNHFPYWISHF